MLDGAINDLDSSPFYKLTPAKADISRYKEAFRFVFDNNDVVNIAISGPYGSGKSSIVEGLKNSKDIYEGEYLTISLAKFGTAGRSPDKPKPVVQSRGTLLSNEPNSDDLPPERPLLSPTSNIDIEEDRILEGQVLCVFRPGVRTKSWTLICPDKEFAHGVYGSSERKGPSHVFR